MQKVRVRKVYGLSPKGELMINDTPHPGVTEVAGESVEEALEWALKSWKWEHKLGCDLIKEKEKLADDLGKVLAENVDLKNKIEELQLGAAGSAFMAQLASLKESSKEKDELIKQFQNATSAADAYVKRWVVKVNDLYYLRRSDLKPANWKNASDVPLAHRYSGFSSIEIFSSFNSASIVTAWAARVGFTKVEVEEVWLPF